MTEVIIKDGESFENALRRFKKKCLISGVMAEMRKREFYESPSVKRKKKEEAATRKLIKRLKEV
jgi:small subunit ribosomal protein S21